MISQRELRIGNLVYQQLKADPVYIYVPVTVESICETGINYLVTESGEKVPALRFDQLHGVPLSAQILKNRGIMRENNFCTFSYGEGAALKKVNGKWINDGTEHSGTLYFNGADQGMKYVHQLQTYYLDLTGNQLTIHL